MCAIHLACIPKAEGAIIFSPHVTRRGYIIEMTCRRHAEGFQQMGVRSYRHIPPIGRLGFLLTQDVASPCRLYADAVSYQKWKLFEEGPEPDFPADHLKFSVLEFETFGMQPSMVRRLCEQCVYLVSEGGSYMECVRHLASRLPQLPMDVVAAEGVKRRKPRNALPENASDYIQTRSSAIPFTRRGLRWRPTGRTGRTSAVPRKATVDHEESVSRNTGPMQPVSSERFWKIIDQTYFKSMPQVANCIPNRTVEGPSVSGLTPPRYHGTRSLFRYQSPLPTIQAMTALNADRLTNRDVRCVPRRVLTVEFCSWRVTSPTSPTTSRRTRSLSSTAR